MKYRCDLVGEGRRALLSVIVVADDPLDAAVRASVIGGHIEFHWVEVLRGTARLLLWMRAPEWKPRNRYLRGGSALMPLRG